MSKLGISAVLYRNTASYGTPTWTAVTCVSDLAINPAWDEADGSTRGSRVKASAKTLLGLEITGKLKVDGADEGYAAIADALLSDTPLDLMILDGGSTTNDVRGWRADFHVFSASQDQAMANVLFDDIVLKPAVSANPTKSVVVASGAPVFSAIPS